MTDSDGCFEINALIDLYIKRAVSLVYRFNTINIIINEPQIFNIPA
jgi:hypothetical protein